MRRSALRLTPLFALLALASATTAGAQTIIVEQPLPGALLTCMPLDLAVELDAAVDPGTFSATLNGSDVTGSFILDPPLGGRIAAHAADVWGSFVLCDAANTLDVSAMLGGSPAHDQVVFDTAGDPYADAVDFLELGEGSGFNAGAPELMLGAPLGGGPFQGSLDVVSLGKNGSVILEFTDNVIVDGPGVDFTVFENTFLLQVGDDTGEPFSEPGKVSVSQDKTTWHEYPCPFTGGPYWPGCAGVYPVLSNALFSFTPHASIPSDVPIQQLVGVPIDPFPLPPGSGGDSFDLAGTGFAWVRYVKIEAASFDTGLPGGNSAAFDVEAVAAVNAAPQPPVAAPVPALSPGSFALLAALLGWLGTRRRIS